MTPERRFIAADVAAALAEDLGTGDLTAELVPDGIARARLLCREAAVLAGRPWFEEVFRQLDPEVSIRWLVEEGGALEPETLVCEIEGPARALLSGERTAINFLQTLSGTATTTAAYVRAVAGTGVRILDTRKTLPGLRRAQKYAVTCGGGHNHRMGLYDLILVKENHIAAAGSIGAALAAAQEKHPGVGLEIEVEDLTQLEEALTAGASRILLDNFSLDELRAAVALTAGRARLEASGGVTLETVRAIAETGVDDISVGALTRDLHSVDFSLRFE